MTKAPENKAASSVSVKKGEKTVEADFLVLKSESYYGFVHTDTVLFQLRARSCHVCHHWQAHEFAMARYLKDQSLN